MNIENLVCILQVLEDEGWLDDPIKAFSIKTSGSLPGVFVTPLNVRIESYLSILGRELGLQPLKLESDIFPFREGAERDRSLLSEEIKERILAAQKIIEASKKKG